MRIVLSGIETNNKGAELMLYAILQEIECKFPDAEVYVPIFAVNQGLNYIKTVLILKDKPWAEYARIGNKFHIGGILRRFGLPYSIFDDTRIVDGVDYFIDASGFAFSDQWNPTEKSIEHWKKILKGYHEQGTKIVFLPQAFGPVEKPNTKRLIALLNQYADIIMPREKISLEYLRQCAVVESKVHLFTDFTSSVEGVFPIQYEHLRNAVCIIPNMRMIDKGIISLDNYLKILKSVIDISLSKGYKVYLLNHEGIGDERLAYMCNKRLTYNIEVVSGLNGLEVKGLIASSYLCISSRFHGVASALNSCVPCLATSWSHKYAELFKDYGLNNCILDLNDIDAVISKVTIYLEKEMNGKLRNALVSVLPKIQKETKEMWNLIWSI